MRGAVSPLLCKSSRHSTYLKTHRHLYHSPDIEKIVSISNTWSVLVLPLISCPKSKKKKYSELCTKKCTYTPKVDVVYTALPLIWKLSLFVYTAQTCSATSSGGSTPLWNMNKTFYKPSFHSHSSAQVINLNHSRYKSKSN
jgi:hypothetical protein